MENSGPQYNAPTQAPASATVPTVPSVWPGAFGLFKNSKAAIRNVLWTYVGLMLISMAVSFAVSIVGGSPENNAGLYLGAQLVSIVASILFSIASMIIEFSGIRNEKISVADSLSKSLPLFVRMLLLGILLGVIAVVSALLFFIPFIFVLPRIILAPYYMVDKNMGVMESFNASWEAGKGLLGKVWGIIGASVVFALPIFTIIGIPVSIYLFIMYGAAWAILYKWRVAQN